MKKSENVNKAASIAFAIFLTLSGSAMVWAVCNDAPIGNCNSSGLKACSSSFYQLYSQDNPYNGVCKNSIIVATCNKSKEGCDSCECKPKDYANGAPCDCVSKRARRLSPISNSPK